MVDMIPTISILFNVKGKRHKSLSELKKQTHKTQQHDQAICCLQQTHFKYKNTDRLK